MHYENAVLSVCVCKSVHLSVRYPCVSAALSAN